MKQLVGDVTLVCDDRIKWKTFKRNGRFLINDNVSRDAVRHLVRFEMDQIMDFIDGVGSAGVVQQYRWTRD